MPWKYSGKVIRVGKSWTNNDGVTHPSNWATWSDADKAKAGLTWEANAATYDSRFYWDANTPRALEDVTGEDGSVTTGLKSQWKAMIKAQAGGLLQPTDWMVIKASEVADYTVPANVLAARAAIRTASNTIEAAIDAAADHTAFMALFDAPTDADGNPTGNAPIANWPE